jgi:hypothetical protein
VHEKIKIDKLLLLLLLLLLQVWIISGQYWLAKIWKSGARLPAMRGNFLFATSTSILRSTQWQPETSHLQSSRSVNLNNFLPVRIAEVNNSGSNTSNTHMTSCNGAKLSLETIDISAEVHGYCWRPDQSFPFVHVCVGLWVTFACVTLHSLLFCHCWS